MEWIEFFHNSTLEILNKTENKNLGHPDGALVDPLTLEPRSLSGPLSLTAQHLATRIIDDHCIHHSCERLPLFNDTPKLIWKQECIPVGCVPSAAVAILLRYRSRCQDDIFPRIELIPSFVLSSDNTNCKNDIQLFHQLFDELSVHTDYH